MTIKELTLEEFQEFVKQSPLSTHYQTLNYALLMGENEFDCDLCPFSCLVKSTCLYTIEPCFISVGSWASDFNVINTSLFIHEVAYTQGENIPS